MKLIIQIPCLNEADTLPAVLAHLPQEMPNISCIETLIIDDGSSDKTVEVAQSLGVTHIIRHKRNLGLAKAFQTGVEACLQLGADIVVNTDGDNQYPAGYIPNLIQPILDQQADIVIGNRQTHLIQHFSPLKKRLQWLGSWTIRTISNTDIPDAVSGFRAYNREALLRLNIITNYSYTIETIIQASKLGLTIHSIPIETNPPTRPSRLQKSTWHFIKSQASTIMRLYTFYEPLRTFSYLATPFLLTGLILWGRFLLNFFIGDFTNRFVQSLTIGTGLLIVGVLIAIFGIQADIASKHRQLTQEMLYRIRKLELEDGASGENASSSSDL